MKLNYYLAKVKTVISGSRNITVTSPLTNFTYEISPFLDGVLKLPVPEVGERVLVMIGDDLNQEERYIPARYTYVGLTDTPTSLQLENTQGNIELDSSEIKLGSGASDFIALAALVKSQLDSIKTVLDDVKLMYNAHTHPGIGAPPAPAFLITTTYTAGEVKCSKVKAE